MKKWKNIGNQKMKKKLCLEEMEDVAFYESGLSADGCLEKIDAYTMESITRYGRILLKLEKEELIEDNI